MKLKILKSFANWRRGASYDVPDGVANELVRRHIAEEVKPEEQVKTPRKTRANRRGTHAMG